MRSFIIALGLALLPLAAAAQVVRMPVCSPWTAWASETKHSFAASPLQLNSLGNLAAISGQRAAIGPIKFLQPSVSVTFKGPAASSTTGFNVVAIRVHHEAACLNMTMAERPLDHLMPTPLLVPPGQPFSCRYDMPLIGTGELLCGVGPLSALPGAVPPPVVTPPPPPPPPPVSTMASSIADGAVIKGSVVWTVVPSRTPDRVEFAVNNVKSPAVEFTPPYRFNGDTGFLVTTTIPNGAAVLRATAFYSDGTSDSRTINVTVAN